ncbi:MAG: flagellar export chaperone FlgN [Planctomycetota bacterium]
MMQHPALAVTGDERDAGRRLEKLLSDLLSEHRTLHQLVGAHREAIRKCDADAIRVCVEQHSAVLNRISGMEQERRALVAELSPGGPRRSIPTFSQLAEHIAEPWRSRTTELAKQLRELVERIAKDQRAVRLASQNLLTHMDGLVKQMVKTLSHSGTYTARGAVDGGGQQVMTGLDLTH